MLKVWNMVLVILTFALTIFGTFLTRSGVISSVHSFTQSGLGPFFIGFLLLVIVVVGRRCSSGGCRELRSAERRSTRSSRASRRSCFNNLILVGIAFAVFWGTVFPVHLGVGARREDHRRAAVLQPRQRAARHRRCSS